MNPNETGIVSAFIAAINRRNPAEIAGLMTEDHTFVDSRGRVESGCARMRAGWTEYFRLFPDYEIQIDSIFAQGEVVAVFGSASGTYHGKRGPVPANRIEMPAAWRAVVENGKVKRWQVYADWAEGTRTMDDDRVSREAGHSQHARQSPGHAHDGPAMTDTIESTLAALRPLLGSWEGAGRAQFPTIAPHEYVESLHFTTEAGRDHIHFEQRARHRPAGSSAYAPSHWESGFLRVTTPGVVEWTNAQDNGRLELARLALTVTPDGLRLEGETVQFLNDPRMIRARRVIVLSGDTLRYQLEMVTTRVATLTTHLHAELRRVTP